jgi:hypothetical protein
MLFVVLINDILEKSENPLWKRSWRGFLFKIDDFLKESLSQSSPQRDPSVDELPERIPY